MQNRKGLEALVDAKSRNASETIIGYSAFRLCDECYEYNENACYIADSPGSLKEFLDGAMLAVDEYRIDGVRIAEILDDFGCSSGEFAMEPEALKRFEQEADLAYSVEPYNAPFSKAEPDLFLVNVDKTKIAAQLDKENRIDRIIKAFEIFDGVYKKNQVDAAIELKKEITPCLIEILEKVLSNPTDPSEFIDLEDYGAHIYSLMLLGHFYEHRAHQIIIDLLSLPEKIVKDLFGDLLFDDFPIILLRTSNGNFDLIKSLSLNKEACLFSRDIALKAMVFAVAEGMLEREELVSILNHLFNDNPASYGWDFADRLARHAHDIYPEDLMDTVKQAYEDGFIAPGFIGLHDFENALRAGKEACLERVRAELQERSLDDIHSRMSWWACFNQERPSVSASPRPTQKREKKKNRMKKKKRKLAKASKRRNR